MADTSHPSLSKSCSSSNRYRYPLPSPATDTVPHNLLTITSFWEGLALYGGAFSVGALFAGIVFGLDRLSNK